MHKDLRFHLLPQVRLFADQGFAEIQSWVLTPEAKEAWIDFYNRHGCEQAALAGNEAALWSKLEGTAPRLALIVQLVSDAESMAGDETSKAAGITLADWFGQVGRRVYGVLGESDDKRDRRQLIELIGQQGGSITANDLRKAQPAICGINRC